MSRRILTNIEFNISDSELQDDLGINDEYFDKEEFLNRLSQISMNWTPYPSNSEIIVFLYPLLHTISENQSEPVYSIPYRISDLPTALETIGAINTWFSQDLITPGVNDLPIEQIRRRGDLTFEVKRYELFENQNFDGLTMLSPGVYYIKLR